MVGAVSGHVRSLLRVEGLCVLAVSILAYVKLGGGWGMFALLFFTPDLSFLGYVAGPKVGAVAYNVAHSFVGALTLMAAGASLSMPAALSAGIIWTAHVGFDRALGYGLKYSEGFAHTHLGLIGRARVDA